MAIQKKRIGLKRAYRKIRLFGLTLLLYLLLFPLWTPFLLFRLFVKCFAKFFRKDLSGLIESKKVFLSSQDIHLNDLSQSISSPKEVYGNFVARLEFNGHLSIEEIQKSVLSNILNKNYYCELRQYPEMFMGYVFWKSDPDFKISDHIRHYSFGNINEIDNHWGTHMQNLIRKGWPQYKSPWEILVTHIKIAENDNIIEKTLVYFRIHHLLCDGNSGMGILEKIFGTQSQVLTKCYKKLWAKKIIYYFRLVVVGLYEYLSQMQICREKKWHSPIEFTRQRFFVWSNKIPVQVIEELQQAHGVSSKAVLLTAVSEGIRKHFIDVGIGVPDKMSVTIAVVQYANHTNKLKHQTSYVPIKFPIYIPEISERLQKFEKYIRKVDKSTLPGFSNNVSGFFGSFALSLQKSPCNEFLSTSVILNEVTGPKSQLQFKGCDLLDITAGFGDLNGNSGFGFTVLKHNGSFRISFATQNCIITSEYEANKVMDKMCASFADLKRTKAKGTN